MFKKLTDIFKSRLSRRVIFWLFNSVIIIEVVILIPSVVRREQELLNYLKTISTEKVSILMQVAPSQASEQDILNLLANLKVNSVIVGGSLYRETGQLVGTFGEKPALVLEDIKTFQKTSLLDKKQFRYDVAWTAKELGRNYFLILRHDSTIVEQELKAFIFRIIGLIIIISLFVTAGTWVALHPIVISPILRLRKDLKKAGEYLCQNQSNPQFSSLDLKRNDELGEVIITFEEMYQKIAQSITERNKAQEELKISYTKIESYSKFLNSELEKGRQIQLDFLPNENKLKQLSIKYNWEFSAFFRPARQVAGDFYDIFELPNDFLGIVIADVCDKGVGAALFMALFRSLIRVFSQQTQCHDIDFDLLKSYQPKQGWIEDSTAVNLAHLKSLLSLSLTNDYVANHHGMLGMFATVFFGVLDPNTGILTYINAGHEPVFILNPNQGIKEILTANSPAVGMISNTEFMINQIILNPQEILLGFTDGITDARAIDDSFFGLERLRQCWQFPMPKASDLLVSISQAVLSHTEGAEQFDDITLLAIQNLTIKGCIPKNLRRCSVSGFL